MTEPAEPQSPTLRKAVRIRTLLATTLVIVLAVLLGLARYGPNTVTGRRFIEDHVSGLTVGRLGRLRIEGLTGDPWTSPRVERLTLSDREGVWLDVRGLAIRWQAGDLLERRVRITAATARALTLVRRPILSPAHKPKPGVVDIEIDRLATRAELTPAAAFRRGVYDIIGQIVLERSGANHGALTAASALHAGDFLTARWSVTHAKAFQVIADAREAQGGALAGLAGLRTDLPFLFTVRAGGALKAGHVAITTGVGAVAPLVVNANWNSAGGEGHGVVLLAQSRLLDALRKDRWPGRPL